MNTGNRLNPKDSPCHVKQLGRKYEAYSIDIHHHTLSPCFLTTGCGLAVQVCSLYNAELVTNPTQGQGTFMVLPIYTGNL